MSSFCRILEQINFLVFTKKKTKMTEGIQSSALRENPELFRIILCNTIEEITACVSDDCATTLFKEKPLDGMLQKQVEFLQSGFKKSVDELINDMWNGQQISQKASYIAQLESTYPPDFIAWRPTTGKIPIENLRAHYLTETKARFLYKMNKCQIESKELEKTLYTKATALRKSLKKIAKSEESLKNLYNEYEKIIRVDS